MYYTADITFMDYSDRHAILKNSSNKVRTLYNVIKPLKGSITHIYEVKVGYSDTSEWYYLLSTYAFSLLNFAVDITIREHIS